MAWWVRRDQWPHMELGPFVAQSDAESLLPQLPDAYRKVGGADWTWTVVEHGGLPMDWGFGATFD